MTRSFSFGTYLAVMSLVLALPLAGLLAYDLVNDFRKSEAHAESVNLRVSSLTAGHIASFLSQSEKILVGLANNPEIRALDSRNCSTLLRELRDVLTHYTNLITRDASGTLVCSAVTPVGGGRPRPAHDYFQEVLRTGGLVVGEPVRGKITGKWVVTLAYPLRDRQDKITGEVLLPIDLVKFDLVRGAVSLPDGMMIQVVSAGGVVVASTQNPGAWVGRNIGHTEFVAKMMTGAQGVIRAPDAEGIPYIYGFVAVPGIHWRVYAGIPAKSVFENSWRQLQHHALIIILTAAIAGLLTFLLARKTIGAIRNIATAATAVAAGDKAARALPAGPTEFRTVATRFNSMLDALDLAERRITSIISSATDGVITVNERHEITLVNPAAERLFGYGAADLLGKPLNVLIPDAYRLAHDEHIRNFARTNVANRMMGRFGQIIGRRADGSEFAIDASISQMQQAGQRQFTVIMRDITRRIEAENALRESEERLRLAVTSGGIGIWEWDIRTDKLIWNDQAMAIFGLPQGADELTVETFLAAIHPEDRDETRQRYTVALENHTEFDHVFRIVRPSGDVCWISSSGHGIYGPDDRPIAMIGATLDITERKRAELALQENYEILDKIFSTTHFCIVYLDQNFNFIRVNKAYADACGYSSEFFPGKSHFELYPGEENEAIFRRVVATGEPFTTHARPFRFPDHPEWGTTYWDWSLHPVRSADGAVEGLLFALVDVTERARTAELERESALRLRLAARAGNIGFWERDLTSGRAYLSPEWKSQLGYRDDEIADDGEGWMSFFHPEDTERVNFHLKACIERRCSEYQTEYRMRHKDGSYRWFYVRGELVSDTAGAPERIVGCRIDITAFKLVQQELESRIALAQLLEFLARAGSEVKGVPAAMQVCLERLCQFGKWTLGRVAIFNEVSGHHLPEYVTWYPAGSGRFDDFIEASNKFDHFKPNGKFVSVTLRDRKPIWLADLSGPCAYGRRPLALAHGLRAAFAVPVIIDDQAAGFFEFYAAMPRPPDPLLMEASELVASQLAAMIEHSRGRQIQARLAAIVESSNDAIVSRSKDSIIESWNAAAERTFGWAAQEIIGKPMSLVVPPERTGALQPLVEIAMRGEHVPPVETTYMHRDGRRIDTYVTLSGVMNEDGEFSTLAMTIRDITEIKRKERALLEYSSSLRRLSLRLLEVEEAERRSISHELHDRIGQDLSALNLTFGMLRSQLSGESRQATETRLKDMQVLLRTIIAKVRDVMSELRPPVLDDYGLFAALQNLFESFRERTGVSTNLIGREPDPRLPSVVETAIFRISQEALNNISKHAQAKKVEISFSENSERLIVEIADDGVGFNAENDIPRSKMTWGILTMRERAEAVGVGFRVESILGSGTRVVLEIARGTA